ncbi:hypothetical protein FGRMN_3031 [Fusarium graminum]|nr:hypothetical protein FGRMN_3031 [Fusarium graminum]
MESTASSEGPVAQDSCVRMEKYRKTMEKALSSKSIHPWQNIDHGWKSRIRVVRFNQGAASVTEPNLNRRSNPQHLWEDLNEALEYQNNSGPKRTLILLEGMDPRIAEALSIKLDIVPEFWVSHYTPSTLTLLSPSGIKHTRSTYWSSYLPAKMRFVANSTNRKKAQFHLYQGSCYRGLIGFNPAHEWTEVWNSVSFWGQRSNNGWTVLIDIPFGVLIPKDEPMITIPGPVSLQTYVEPFSGPGLYSSSVIVSLEDPVSHKRYTGGLPLWDSVLQAYETEKVITTNDPFSAATIVRNFIFLKWQYDISERYNPNHTIWISGVSDSFAPFEVQPDHRNTILERGRKVAADYQSLRVSRQYLQHYAFFILDTIQALGFDNTDSATSNEDDEFHKILSQESRRWTGLREHIRMLDDLISGNMAMYAQRSTMEEAFLNRLQAYDSYEQTRAANEQASAANRTARSSGQLTKIATVAVPFTVAASILSMNGDFAAGERLFFIYWCVALPLTFALLAWVMQDDLQGLKKRALGKRRNKGDDHDTDYDT